VTDLLAAIFVAYNYEKYTDGEFSKGKLVSPSINCDDLLAANCVAYNYEK